MSDYSEYYKKTWEKSVSNTESSVSFKPNNHIKGKVYDLTQENMNEMIKTIENHHNVVLDFQANYQLAVERIEQLTMDASRLKVENDKYREALEIISKEETDSVLPVHLYIAPTNVKRNYMDEAYRLIAREALKGE